jgi:hypothetical protein
MRPPFASASFHDARHVLQAQANETISIPDEADVKLITQARLPHMAFVPALLCTCLILVRLV